MPLQNLLNLLNDAMIPKVRSLKTDIFNPKDSVKIDRSTIWGNPYSHSENTKAKYVVATRAEAISSYEVYLSQNETLQMQLHLLKDKNLFCHCKPLACHGDVLFKWANAIFVFGSNYSGRHGKGAALYAVNHYQAEYGKGEGLQGQSYGIPTKNENLRTLSLDIIKKHVDKFLEIASYRGFYFRVTKIGCGLAGYSESDIRPMFKDAPANCLLPYGWRNQ